MISTLPCTHSVTAFCQWTILRGSYVAFRRSVCSMARSRIVAQARHQCQAARCGNSHIPKGLAWWVAVALAAGTAACWGRSAVPRPFPTPGGTARTGVAAPASPFVESLLRTATDLLGTPYRNGGSTVDGFD